MATVATIIKRSLRLLGQLGAGAEPTADEYADALEVLNELVDAWKNDKVLTYARREETLTLSNGVASYTIGPSGDLDTVRPDDIEAAWIEDGGITHPVYPLNDLEFAGITVKAMAGDWPQYVNYKPSMPTGTLTTYPVSNATRTMKLLTRVPLEEFTATTDTVSLPPGFRKALAANLAIAIAPEYEREPSMAVMKMASESKKGLARINARPVKAHSDLRRMLNGQAGNILTDS